MDGGSRRVASSPGGEWDGSAWLPSQSEQESGGRQRSEELAFLRATHLFPGVSRERTSNRPTGERRESSEERSIPLCSAIWSFTSISSHLLRVSRARVAAARAAADTVCIPAYMG